jgi:hypothetical protein
LSLAQEIRDARRSGTWIDSRFHMSEMNTLADLIEQCNWLFANLSTLLDEYDALGDEGNVDQRQQLRRRLSEYEFALKHQQQRLAALQGSRVSRRVMPPDRVL